MDLNSLNKTRHDLLAEIENELQENLIAARLIEPGQEGDPDILTVIFDELGSGEEEAFGEFCFLPTVSEEADIQYFSSIITLSDDVSPEYLTVLYEAMSYINFKLPCGSFQIDDSHTFLTYKLTAPLPIELSGEALKVQVDMLMGNTVAVTSGYFDLILSLSRGEASIDNVLEILGVEP